MIRKSVFVVSLIVVIAFLSPATADVVKFKNLSAELSKPTGEGLFPAIVLLHGCTGITPSYDAWIKRLVSWNYVTLMLDSFGPRGIKDDCRHPFHIPLETRVQEAYAAKSYLAETNYVDPSKIAVMGWSYGGVATTYAVTTAKEVPKSEQPFGAGIAFYPGCHKIRASLNAPLLILIGEKDDWTTVRRCKALKKSLLKKKSDHELILKVYTNTYHAFDIEGINRKVWGHQLKYNPEAAADAIEQVKGFLGKHMQ